MTNNTITVSQVAGYIKSIFDAEEMLHNIDVVGEISGIKQSGNAVYFTLKDETAQIQCSCFMAEQMRKDGKLIPDGTKVIARGSVTYWNKLGKIAFNVRKCEIFGAGELFALIQKLREKLEKEGIFDTAKKKSIPANVKRIGVVTSKTGAVIHDIKMTAWRRDPNIDIVLFPVKVQGEGSDAEIVNAINVFNKMQNVDVMIVGRGGGSVEDLMAFNSESVVRAVFASKIPIVSAVGHESDWTLTDFASDIRASTPTAAAELCAKETISIRREIISKWQTLKAIAARKIDREMSTQNWINLKNIGTKRYSELEGNLAVLGTNIEAKNPIAILKSGFAKPMADLNLIKTGDEFEILYNNNDTNKISKGVAEWKRKVD